MGKKNKAWVLPRHKRVTRLLDFLLRPFITRRYGLSVEEFPAEGGPYLILYNHQTGFDQFFVGLVLRGEAIYYVASEDIFSLGLASRLIKYLVNPIPIKKQSADIRAVLNCMKVAREGGNIAIAPEGNRTFSGRTGHFNHAIAALAKKLGMPIAFLRIEGGYGVQPRWSDVVRRGHMRAFVSRVLSVEEYREMTDEELCELIGRELYVDESAPTGEEYFHKRSAERLERLLYVCPECGLSEFRSHADTVRCLRCSLEVRYTKKKELVAKTGKIPFNSIGGWYDYQESFINSLDTASLTDAPIYTDRVLLSRVIPYKRKIKIRRHAECRLFGNRIEIDTGRAETLTLDFDTISVVTVLGKNKINIYAQDKVYQLKGAPEFCAVKYMHLFYRYKNTVKETENGTFLGI
ncbi:MAG: 1-acyl-sn-glycerol-3-phosphate acyltransferase [Clostridia bacterium]|nr:1-acyl-sn-glycerol-3-phosphate acyltransferase [Clostridia bacterium]